MKIKTLIIVSIVFLVVFCVIPMLLPSNEPEIEQPIAWVPPETTESATQELASEEPMTTEPTDPTASAPATEPITTQEPATEPPTEPEPPSEELTVPETQEPVDEDILAQIDALLASVYELRDHYSAELTSIEEAAINKYYALPEAERTEETKMAIAIEASDAAYALEKECNIKIDTICAELGYLLTCADMSLHLVSEVRYAYAYEKEAVKNTLSERYGELFSG